MCKKKIKMRTYESEESMMHERRKAFSYVLFFHRNFAIFQNMGKKIIMCG